jgi:mannose-1-phosphate guanylyltransferase
LCISHYAVILAGGRGERFWPLSQPHYPKQFLDIFEGKPLIQQTIDRLKGFCHCSSRYLVIPQHLKRIARDYATGKNIIIEPEQRNTAAAICLAALHVQKHHGPASIIHVMPADHLIRPRKAFQKTLLFSHSLCRQGYCVTYGITPSRPETGYGYIKTGASLGIKGRLQAFKGLAFTEKPTRRTAQRYLRSKKYLWNSGIFSFRVSTILEEMKTHAPRVYQGVSRYFTTKQKDHFKRVPNTSIDYAVMEHSDRLCIVQGIFSWDDVGSWLALERYFSKGVSGNILKGNIKGLAMQDSIIYTSDIPCRVYGIKGLIIVVSPDGVLVCSKDHAPDIKRLLNA